MKYPEEDMASDLYREMVKRFTALAPTVNGLGVHWRCAVELNDRACLVHCFTLPNGHEREYYTLYQQKTESVAFSRVPSRDETLDAIADWLNGADRDALYARYWFIDATKRRLTQIRDQAIAAEPELQNSTESELLQQIGDIYRLLFRGGNRACEVSFYGKAKWPDAKFSWDECHLFEYQPDDWAELAAVLRRWLCDTASPSAMRKEFPWLVIDKLADYYESGNPIEGEFIKSWDCMEEFYRKMDYPGRQQVVAFLAAMRERGYDQKLRAGQSLWSLILSRSRRHGLRHDHRTIQFRFRKEGMDILVDGAGMVDMQTGEPVYREKRTCPKIQLTSEIVDLIEQLTKEPVD